MYVSAETYIHTRNYSCSYRGFVIQDAQKLQLSHTVHIEQHYILVQYNGHIWSLTFQNVMYSYDEVPLSCTQVSIPHTILRIFCKSYNIKSLVGHECHTRGGGWEIPTCARCNGCLRGSFLITRSLFYSQRDGGIPFLVCWI